MSIADKLFITLFVVGAIGVVVNGITAKNPYNIKNHTYSTMPMCASILYGIIKVLIFIWSK